MLQTSCTHCESGEISFEVEPPDRSVGIMGYQVFIDTTKVDGHDNGCKFRLWCGFVNNENVSNVLREMANKELDDIAVNISYDVYDGKFDPDPPGV